MQDQTETALIALRRILKATANNVKAVAHQTGLTASQLLVLQVLKTRGETLTGDLAKAVDLKQATISILLDKLQDRGFVERERGEADRRRVWVRITDSGARTLEGAPDLLQETFRSRFRNLADWEQASLVAALLRLVSLLDAEEIDASPLLDVGGINDLPANGSR
ncbi:MarR family winged helix-turn-helix transcriptional regulator [Henriciella aquimarina]|uniref:MarR family winged helix-turn-helix transcriptional regulator n=1 Tax=Henriciella aquimarina TaxID=545261 RepID=UPI001F3E7D03|nr:MarR family transcriptional regulator [Henriciella aquimarina]